MRWQSITSLLVLAGVVIYVAWDVFVFVKAGGEATESVTVGTWMQRSLWVTLAVGLLVGHLLHSGPDGVTWRHYLILAAGLVMGYFCTAN